MPVVMKPPARPAPADQATHRHRGDGRPPVGEQQQHERAGDEDERHPGGPVPGRRLPEAPRASPRRPRRRRTSRPASRGPVATPTPRNASRWHCPGGGSRPAPPTAENTTASAEMKRSLPASPCPRSHQPAASSPARAARAPARSRSSSSMTSGASLSRLRPGCVTKRRAAPARGRARIGRRPAALAPPRVERGDHRRHPGGAEHVAREDVGDVVHAERDAREADRQHEHQGGAHGDPSPRAPQQRQEHQQQHRGRHHRRLRVPAREAHPAGVRDRIVQHRPRAVDRQLDQRVEQRAARRRHDHEPQAAAAAATTPATPPPPRTAGCRRRPSRSCSAA